MAKRKSNLSLQNANNNNLINKNSRTLGQINSTSLKGASSGQKTRNKYLQDFEKLKAGYSNKKGKKKWFLLLYLLSTVHLSLLFVIYQLNYSFIHPLFINSVGGQRYISQTLPVMSDSNNNGMEGSGYR